MDKKLSNKKSRHSRQSRNSRHARSLPKTAVLNRTYTPRKLKSSASNSMNMTELEDMARSMGIPFGGLSKTKLIRKINNY